MVTLHVNPTKILMIGSMWQIWKELCRFATWIFYELFSKQQYLPMYLPTYLISIFDQAVPVLVDGSSQTELKHPKNVYTQYEPRVFTNEEVAKIWESNEMQKFLSKAEGV